MSTQASTIWRDGGTHIDGPFYVDGIPLQFPNSTAVFLRGDGQFKAASGAGNSTVNSTVVIGGVTFVITGGLITSLSS